MFVNQEPQSDVMRLRWPLLASLACHVVLLMPAPPPPMHLSLVKPLAVALAPAPAASVSARPVHDDSVATARPRAVGRPLKPAEHPAPRATPPAPHAPPGPAAQLQQASDALTSQTGEIDADALRGFRVAVAVAARRVMAGMAGPLNPGELAGSVTLSVAVEGPLGLPRVWVEKSSGQPALDERACALLKQALSATRLPEGLRLQRFQFEVPIVFSASAG